MANTPSSYNYIAVDNVDDLDRGLHDVVDDAPAHDPRDADYEKRDAADLYAFASGQGEPRLPGEPPLKKRAKDGTGFEMVPEEEAFASIMNDDDESAVDGSHLSLEDFDQAAYHPDKDIGDYVALLKRAYPEVRAIVDKGFGVFPELGGKMGSAEITVKTVDGVNTFESLRPHLPALAKTLALSMNYTEMDLDRNFPDREITHYKVMVILFCTFIKINMDGSKEYRTFVFDQMAEDDKGHYYAVVSADSIYKAVYNTFLKVAYEKLDMRNVANVPNIDSKFEFYSMRTAGATLFRYNALKVNGKEDD